MPKLIASILIVLVVTPSVVEGQVTARVGDITTLKGHGSNYLTGMGLIVGLNGTGDGDDYATAMRPLAKALEFYANPVVAMEELKDTKNVAIVFLTAELPPDGVREGSRIDIQVSPFGSCKSLKGGVLLPAPLLYPDRRVSDVFALAQGSVYLNDEGLLTSGVVENGAVIQKDVIHNYIAKGRDLPFSSSWVRPAATYLTLVIQDTHASWSLAREIAQIVDTTLSLAADVDHVALAVDPKNVLVFVPPSELASPADWISQIKGLELLMTSTQAKVVINRTTGTLSVSGDARISPVVVSHQGLTITIAAPSDDDEETAAPLPDVERGNFVAIDPGRTGGSNLNQLTAALNRLNVPIESRIAIVMQIHELGALHAKLVIEK